MTDQKAVLLARPHPMIVRYMKPFLESLGLAGQTAEDLNTVDSGNVAAAVISTSVSSTVDTDPDEALDIIRGRFPNLPLVVATLIPDIDHVRQAFRRSRFANDLDFVKATEAGQGDRTKTVLVVHKDEIANPDDALRRIINRHIGA